MAILNEKVKRDGEEMVALERHTGTATVGGAQYPACIEIVREDLWRRGSFGVVATVQTPAGEKCRKVWVKTMTEAQKLFAEQAAKLA